MNYRHLGWHKTLHLGAWPEVGIAAARAKRDAARMQLAADLDPAAERKRAKVAARVVESNSFKAVAEEWLVKNEKEGRAPITLEKIRWLLRNASPMIGSLPISKITAEEALAVLRKMEGNGRDESARRMRSVLSRVFRYGIATARADRDVARDRRKLALYCARLTAIRAMRSLRWRSRSPPTSSYDRANSEKAEWAEIHSCGALVASSR